MAYRLDLPPKVRKILDCMDPKTFHRVDAEIVRLKDDPRPPGCVKLEGHVFRVRAGDWRVIYAVFDAQKLVQIIRVARRCERTYRRLP